MAMNSINVDLNINQVDELEKKLTRTIHDLEMRLDELVVFSHIDKEQLRRLKHRWIVSFLSGKTCIYFPVDLTESHRGTHVVFQAPSGRPATPSFTIFYDDYKQEYLVANRAEILSLLRQATSFSITDLLVMIEEAASPLEQLADQAE